MLFPYNKLKEFNLFLTETESALCLNKAMQSLNFFKTLPKKQDKL